MMADRMWPSWAYIRRVAMIYLAAAGAAGVIAFVALVTIYDSDGGRAFLAGFLFGAAVAAATVAVVMRLGLLERLHARALEFIQHQPRSS